MKNNIKNNKVQRTVISGVFIALASVLSMVIVYKLPYGGSITLMSMLPIMVLGYMYGIKYGILCGAVYGIVQTLLGATMSSAFAGLTGFSLLLMALLDYLLAFMSLGTAGVFKNKIKNHTLAFALGATVAGMLRFICHFISGVILWGSYAQWFFGTENMNNNFGNSILENFSGTSLSILYSAIYNGSYMIPEIIITIIGVIVIMNVKPIRNKITSNNTHNNISNNGGI